MKTNKVEFNKTVLERATEIETINKMLDMQRYPAEAEKYLNVIAEEASEIGWKWVVAKVYCFGVIHGKQEERRRKCVMK